MIFSRLRHLLLEESTGPLRFFFGWGSIGYALSMPQFVDYPMYHIALEWLPAWLWSAAFAINGTALIVGALHNNPSRMMYLLEGILGATVWLTLGISTAMAQGMPGPTFFASFIAVWIFVRYPEWK